MPAVSIEHVPDRSTSAPRQGTNRMLRPAYIKPNWRTTDPPVSGELDSQSVVRARMVGRRLTMSPPSLSRHHPSDFYRPLSHPCGGHLASVCTLTVAFRAMSSLPGLLSSPLPPHSHASLSHRHRLNLLQVPSLASASLPKTGH